MKRLLVILLCLALMPLNVPSVWADDSDIFGANIQPNVMIFIDNSGSMDDTIVTTPYDPNGSFTGTYTQTAVYQYKNNKYSVYATTVDAVDSSKARSALNSVGHWNGKIAKSSVNLYLGKYLNWQVLPGATAEKKIVIARRVLTNLIQNVEGIRFGLATFTGNSLMGHGGARIAAPIGSDDTTLVNALSGITPSGYTPLGESLRDLGNYYKGTMSGQTSPIQSGCQPNFVIMMTDGLQNGSMDLPTEALNRQSQDHSSTYFGTQKVIVDTVGFAIGADEQAAANDVLQAAANNGGGKFYSTESEQELEIALQKAIQQIVAATFTFATPVIPTTSTTGLSRAYMAAVESNPSSPFWKGYLKAYNRDADGKVKVYTSGDKVGQPNEDAGCYVDPPDNTKPCLAWEAGSLLADKSAASRTIKTVVGGALTDFTTANITPSLLGTTITTADRDKIVNFIRGVDSTDENGNNNFTEEREWKLGDIFHSTPVVVTKPFLPPADSAYKTFQTTNASRPTLVIGGANDGMLHAFQESDGTELWGFIPPDQLSRLNLLIARSGEHNFYVDSSPIAADVKIQITGDTSPQWRTVVIFGERRGGKYFHALNITSTGAPQYLWSFTDPATDSTNQMIETWSQPVIGKVKMDSSTGSTEKYVAIFGGGYDTSSNNTQGKALYVVDIATGQLLWKYFNNVSSSAVDDRKYMNYSLAADPLAVALNNTDGFIDRIYIGDVGGQVWKFDLHTPATLSGTPSRISNWAGKRLFKAYASLATSPDPGEFYPRQAIYSALNAALDSQSHFWLYFGTGDRNHPNSTTYPNLNRFYGIQDTTTNTTVDWDNSSNGTPLKTESDLTNMTSSTTVPAAGWYILLGGQNFDEKVLASANVFNGVVFFTTFTPTSSASCGGGGGNAKLYALQTTTSYAALDFSTGNLLQSTDASQARSLDIGTGIPSKPIVVLTDSGTTATVSASVVAATTSQQLPSNPAPAPGGMRRILYWREVF